MLLIALQRFASSERRILLVLCLAVVLADSLTWFGAVNYYSEYEGFLSRLTRFNFGSDDNPRWFDLYSPVSYFMYERIWGVLNALNYEIPWYDITMWLLFILSKWVLVVAFWIGTEEAEKKQGYKIWIRALCIGLLVHIPFHWVIRIQNHTHIAYIVCFSFSVLLVQLSRKATPDSGMVFLSSIGFMLGAFLRWEIGFIVASVLFVFVLAQYGLRTLWKFKVVFAMFGALMGYILINYATDGTFYREIEPNGEYVVLYAKSLSAPIGVSEDVQLRYDMLNNWMLDDTTFMNLDFFKSVVESGRVLIPINETDLVRLIGSVFHRIVLSSHCYGLIILCCLLLFVRMSIGEFLFVILVYALMCILDLVSLLNERHFLNIVSGMLLLLFSSRLKALLQIHLVGLVQILFVASIVQISQAESVTEYYAEKEVLKRNFAKSVTDSLRNEVLYTDAQYDVLVSNQVFECHQLLNSTVFLSLQQYSYSNFFDAYLTERVGVGFGNYRKIYEAICRSDGYAYLLISESRLKVLKRVLLAEGSTLRFETVVACKIGCDESGDPFSRVSLQKLTHVDFIDQIRVTTASSQCANPSALCKK